MTNRLLLFMTAAVLACALNAQQPPVYQVVNCIKVLPGKFGEYRQFTNDATKKVAQVRADAGEILSWSLLRNVMPAGAEARCDYRISTLYEGSPRPPAGPEELGKALQKAGVNMTAADYLAKRDSLTRLVATEMWRPRVRVGQPQKGNYAFINYMKVLNAADYYKFEGDIWRPMAEQWVKEGSQSAWLFSTLILPAGTEVKYAALSADIFPNWDAVFKARSGEEVFKKAHPDKDYQQTLANLPQLRDLARRELVFFEERVTKK